MHDLAVEFGIRGHRVYVITPGMNLTGKNRTYNLEGINVLSFRSGGIKGAGRVRRAINEMLLPIRAWQNLNAALGTLKCELIVYYSPTIFWGCLVQKLKKRWNARSYLVLRDIFPQWAVDAGLIGGFSPITYFFRLVEKQNYRAADRIGVMSPASLSWFQNRNYHTAASEVLYNWGAVQPSPRGSKFRKKHGLEKKILFFYGGNIGTAQQIENLLDLASRMRDNPKVFFVFMGSGDSVPMVNEYLKSHASTNALCLPAESPEDFYAIQAEMDVGLISLHRDHTTHNFPGKILGYLGQGLPVLGCVNPGNDLLSLINDSGAGIVSISGDSQKLLQGAKALMSKAARRRCSREALKLLKKRFSTEVAATQILRII